ncbi:MAG: endonuclease [Verrucomicrobiia bacterium]
MRIPLHVRIWLTFVFIFIVPNVAPAQQLPPYSYYATTSNTTSTTLKSALHDIVKGHTVISYTPTHDALVVLDQDPTNSANVILIYSGYSVAASTWPGWNREHIWPESFGTSSGTQHSDLFNLRACDAGVNSSRGNKYYDVSTGTIGHYSGAPQSSYDSDSWEPWDPDKGYVARACFYMTTRYDGTGGDAYFQLAESPNAGGMIFAKLSTMLDWNRRFPPTDYERNRNGVIYQTYQHNRNPFIDNPDFADMVFLGVDGFTAWQGTHFPQAELTNATVSGAAADPDCDGMPNLAEYAFGHDPHVAEAGAVQSPTVQTDGGTNYLYVTHHRNHYASGITITYEASTDLTSWAEATPETVSATQIDAQKDLVTVRFVASGPSEFVRLRIHRLADEPDVVPEGATMVSEGCTPANGVLDPGETVTVNFSLQNVGSENTSNLVATLLATGGVTSPSGAQTYGVVTNGGAAVAQPFTFTATGACGGTLIATLQLQDDSTSLGTITYVFTLGQVLTPLDEGFDGVTPPDLPTDWTTSASGAQSNWVTSATQADTPPNAAFSPDPGDVGVNELVTPTFFISSASARLMFQQNYDLTASATNSNVGYDGGVLEIKIGGGSFQDILDAGGTFVSGGYNTMLSGDYTNPLAGRQAWSGNSGGFLTTTVNLPAAAAGQNVQLRWRCGSGSPPIAPAAVVLPLSYSGTVVGWDTSTLPGGLNNFGPSPFAATTNDANISAGGVTRGSGVTQSGTAAVRAWGGNGWVDGSSADAITNNRVVTFTIQANPGFRVSLSSISKFDYRRSSTGPPNGLLQYQAGSADSFHDITTVSYSSTSSSGASIGTIDLSSISALQNVAAGTVVTFRIVNWGGGSAGTWYIFDKDGSTASDFEIQGSVSQGGAGSGWYIDSAYIEDGVCCGTSGP